MIVRAVALFIAASSALAAPKIEHVAARPAASSPELEVSISIARGRFDTGNCDARVDFGDGQGRSVDFGVARTRSVRHTYKKGGNYTVIVKGAGTTPCEGTQQATVRIAGAPEPKKANKAEPKKKSARKDDRKKAEKKEEAK